jgi:acyl-CoA synthetase (NDP forming)
MSGLDRMIDPRSIAIAGLSADPTKHGRRVLRHLETMGYSGQVFGVNPGMPHVDGVVMVGSVDEMATPPDLVVSAVPASAVASVVLGCAGAGGVVVFAGGFGESGEEGRQREKHLRSVADRICVRILGPNSGGIIRPDIGLTASFLTCLDRPVEQIRPGPVGLVTQSGGTGSYVHNLAAERGSGLAISISTGNEADVRLGEALSIVASLDAVQVVMVVLETVRDGPGFIDAVRRCIASGKPVVACRLGAGRLGQELMTTHTGALAAPTGVLAGVMDTLGVHVAETPGEAYEVAENVARLGRTGPRVGVITHSGGLAILLSDLAERHELDLPTPSRGLVETLAPLLDQGAADNPLDMGGIIGGPSRFSDVIDVVASSGEYDVVLAVTSAHPPAHTASRVENLLRLQSAVPLAHLWMAGDQGDAGLAELREAGFPVATDPRVAVRALSVAAGQPLSFVERPPPIPGPVTEWGLPFMTTTGASSAGDTADAADAIGYPVVVKIASPDVAHKTEIGGVILDLRSREHVIDAYSAIVANARRAGVDTADVSVEPFRPGLEVIVGGLFDDQLGALVSVGIGGIHTEILDDIAFAPAPVTEEEAMAMIDRLRMRLLLEGARGAPAADVPGLAGIVSLVSRGVASGRYREVEINPLIWDGTWVAVDWLAR